MAERDFKGVWIPREIWLDERLNATEKIILAEIDSLDNSEDGCWASNEYLAQFCQCSAWKISSAVSKLVKLGFLKVVSFDGRRRKIKSCLTFFKMQTFENPKADEGKSKEIGISKGSKKVSITRRSADSDFSAGFMEFWKLYPRKVAKPTAHRAWLKTGADDSKALKDSIIADIRRRVNGEWNDKDVQYIPHPSTYLNQRRWEDEPPKPEPEKPRHLYSENLSPEELMRRQKEQAEKDREEARRQGLL